jgi:hypothetical protein
MKLRGAIAAGEGIVVWMQMPTNEQVDGDITSCFTQKAYYAYGLQVCTHIFIAVNIRIFLYLGYLFYSSHGFCDAKCHFVMIYHRCVHQPMTTLATLYHSFPKI